MRGRRRSSCPILDINLQLNFFLLFQAQLPDPFPLTDLVQQKVCVVKEAREQDKTQEKAHESLSQRQKELKRRLEIDWILDTKHIQNLCVSRVFPVSYILERDTHSPCIACYSRLSRRCFLASFLVQDVFLNPSCVLFVDERQRQQQQQESLMCKENEEKKNKFVKNEKSTVDPMYYRRRKGNPKSHSNERSKGNKFDHGEDITQFTILFRAQKTASFLI